MRSAENAFGANVITDEAIRLFHQRPVLIQENGCWHWDGAIGKPWGYGFLYTKEPDGRKKTFLAHRVSFHIHNGSIPKGALVCHTCDNPRCVRPNHLFAGTNQDNMTDRTRKGRQRIGEAHPHAKLNDVKVAEAKLRMNNGESVASVARAFNVAESTMRYIKNGRHWTHVKPKESA